MPKSAKTCVGATSRTRFNSTRRFCVRLVLPMGEWRKIGEEGKYDTLQIVLYQGLHLVAPHVP